ncbi:MAG: glutaredoxin family protein [Pirellulales bacterium]
MTTQRRWETMVATMVVVGAMMARPQDAAAQWSQAGATSRCVRLELYLRGSDGKCQQAAESLAGFLRQRPGMSARVYDLDKENAVERLGAIGRHFGISQPPLPFLYGCNQKIVGFRDAATFRRELEALLRVNVYTRMGCPRCNGAKAYLVGFAERYPAFEVRVLDVVADRAALDEVYRLGQRYNTSAASLPVFHFCDQLLVGFDQEGTTGRRLETALATWTYDCPAANKPRGVARTLFRPMPQPLGPTLPARVRVAQRQEAKRGESGSTRTIVGSWPTILLVTAPGIGDSVGRTGSSPPELPVPSGQGELPLPLPDAAAPGEGVVEDATTIDLPMFGRLSAYDLGLPLFTLAVGLVDGFNPCAMWVLVFLLSVLVNLHSRAKILAVAGTFVVISGLAYFAFMAAWLNVFLFVGLLRPVQVTLAVLALAIGAIHIKDFFAFKRGISLSIPESARPRIYERVRRIVMAEHLWGAILGASVLAVLVNMIELLCTAGLPALYTQILSLHQLPPWANYLYLALYNAAYMADDALMVTIVVITLGRRKMQETQGRWLKLISGTVVFALGVVLLVKPEWLM